nr:MAG TPA: hypothetical protein [Caudoviricetes sp.]
MLYYHQQHVLLCVQQLNKKGGHYAYIPFRFE